jgi:hypothetical protein
MHRKSQGSQEPLSTHATVQMLVRPGVQPRVSVNMATDPEAGNLQGLLFLTVEAEHRTKDFDHTVSFTVSGPPAAVDRLLLAMRSAYASRMDLES